MKSAKQIDAKIGELFQAQQQSDDLETRMSIEITMAALRWTKGDLSQREIGLILESLVRVCGPFS
jgi:hypothetical protein